MDEFFDDSILNLQHTKKMLYDNTCQQFTKKGRYGTHWIFVQMKLHHNKKIELDLSNLLKLWPTDHKLMVQLTGSCS